MTTHQDLKFSRMAQPGLRQGLSYAGHVRSEYFTRLVLPAVLLMGFSGRAVAADDRPVPEAKKAQLLERFPGIDANQDGQLTRQEAKAFFASRKAGARRGGAAPPDQPGQPPKTDEVGRRSRKGPGAAGGTAGDPKVGGQAGAKPPNAGEFLARFPDADTNQDGRLAPEELRAYFRSHGAEMRAELLKRRPEVDSDGDGTLSDEEFRAARRDFMSRKATATPGEPFMDMILKRHPAADVDKDGRLSESEFAGLWEKPGAELGARVMARFPAADMDNNGSMSVSEAKAFREILRKRAGVAKATATQPTGASAERSPAPRKRGAGAPKHAPQGQKLDRPGASDPAARPRKAAAGDRAARVERPAKSRIPTDRRGGE
ncbi:MAG: hypothetical protein AMXMBFR13_25290 [Phycisphaerae bacterium]